MLRLFLFAVAVISAQGSPKLVTKGQDAFVVGGRPAEQGEVPYQLSLRHLGTHHCSASLIKVEGLLLGITAAHCTPNGKSPDKEFTLVAGDLDISDKSGREQTRQVVKIFVHEEFNETTYANDIALLFIDRHFELNDNIRPIDLPPINGMSTNGQLFVSGWGRSTQNGLQIVEVPIVDKETCQSAYAPLENQILEHFLCAGYFGQGGKGVCQGGSPARSIDGNYLAGIVSWSKGCGDPDYPSVYTEVSYFNSWITDKVRA